MNSGQNSVKYDRRSWSSGDKEKINENGRDDIGNTPLKSLDD